MRMCGEDGWSSEVQLQQAHRKHTNHAHGTSCRLCWKGEFTVTAGQSNPYPMTAAHTQTKQGSSGHQSSAAPLGTPPAATRAAGNGATQVGRDILCPTTYNWTRQPQRLRPCCNTHCHGCANKVRLALPH